jgi:hypothetical protein
MRFVWPAKDNAIAGVSGNKKDIYPLSVAVLTAVWQQSHKHAKRAFKFGEMNYSSESGLFFPNRCQARDGLHRFVHVLHTYVFLFAVEGHFACKDVRAGKAHE